MDDVLTALSHGNKLRDHLYFHDFDKWTIVDWSNAVAGEVGEMCNIIKKMKRLNCPGDYTFTKADIANEAADIVIYLEILCQNSGIDLRKAIIRKFNATSNKLGINVLI